MRFCALLFLPLLFSGLLCGQDTNFAVGPQYLATSGSAMFLRPIATPSMSLGAMPPAAAGAAQTEAIPPQETPSAPGMTIQTFLGGVYWGEHSAGELESHRIQTPSLSPAQVAENVYATATATMTAAATPSAQLPTSGAAAVTTSVIEITSAELPPNLPASIFDTGVTAVADTQSLRDRGYELSLGEVAAYWKAHKRPAPHVFNNLDLERHRS